MNQDSDLDHQKLYANFKWERPTHYNFATDVIDRWARDEPDKLAIFWIDDNADQKQRTFAQISSNSKSLANGLKSAGVKRGDVIILMLGRKLSGGNPLLPLYAWALLYRRELVNFLPKILPIESQPQQLPLLSLTPPMLIKLKNSSLMPRVTQSY